MFIPFIFGEVELQVVENAIAPKDYMRLKPLSASSLKDNARTSQNETGSIRLLDAKEKTLSKSKLFCEQSSTYLLQENTRYIDIVASRQHSSWLDVTVISLFSIDGHQRSYTYRIPAAKSQFSRIDLASIINSGLVPMAVKITPDSQQD